MSNPRLVGVVLAAIVSVAALVVTGQPGCSLSAPPGFSAIYAGGAVHFAWSNDTTGCARGYQIWRDGVRLSSVQSGASWSDTNVGSGASIRYRVTAIGPETLIRDGPSSPEVTVVIP